MSVIIQNMGLVPGKKGVYAYDIRINREFVARCHHKRVHGLEVLLRLAAEAVEANPGGIRKWNEETIKALKKAARDGDGGKTEPVQGGVT